MVVLCFGASLFSNLINISGFFQVALSQLLYFSLLDFFLFNLNLMLNIEFVIIIARYGV